MSAEPHDLDQELKYLYTISNALKAGAELSRESRKLSLS